MTCVNEGVWDRVIRIGAGATLGGDGHAYQVRTRPVST